MTTVRNAKKKGAAFEYDCIESLQQAMPGCYLTKQRGFVQQYDIIDDSSKSVFECKRHKKFTLNEIEKTFKKLKLLSPTDYKPYVLFKPNNCDCYVAYVEVIFGQYQLAKFIDVFDVPFKKHTPIKKVKQNESENMESKDALEAIPQKQEEHRESKEEAKKSNGGFE